ncbi:hypothetical protein U4I37_04655 [Stenotrophomonas maltophilia]|uniref:AbiTii domain-containing protein n=1 Tax=Stenotrophomonas TaxID=40323 RepID=UPI00131274B0|nr:MULTISPECIES: hypothetical protein [Stenotrophomonas]MBH1581647.1 hypothetical protein [Stenotrophomonas maltophilia]MCU1208666.1 hypothetical protein [Stenotrophomonas maltophilia]MDQ7308898.1 hypothetical protein [Stenotrophomonas sp. Sm3119]MDZ5785525.1 hypothetical protein [Stenotrophomonas maltophilia]HDS1554866.1 hypothetical protein [Stenotrophomonas maltophilia]
MTSATKAAAHIISILGSEQCNLVNALIQARILASQIGQDQLNEWVGWELTGYPEGAELPPYRRVKLTPKANLFNGVYRLNNQQLPTLALSEKQRERILVSSLRQSVVAIERWTSEKVHAAYPPEFAALFRDVIDPTYEIVYLWGEPGVGAYDQVLVEIRSRLLGYVLDLQKTLPQGDDTNEPEPSSMKDKRDSMFHGAIFGPGATIQVGNSNIANVTNTVIQGDMSTLLDHLRSSGVPEADLQLLPAAITADGDAPKAKGRLGSAVGGWVGGVLGKAAEGVWEIGVSAAGTLVAQALSSYYGFPVS